MTDHKWIEWRCPVCKVLICALTEKNLAEAVKNKQCLIGEIEEVLNQHNHFTFPKRK